uniref:Phosphatase and actin regulator n=1 Tax=Sinocyclocheilus grahami TaxID=75366 RepID=A0A672NTD2_SINGR
IHSESLVSGSHCRSRLASLGRLFKPWKWRKKKSEKFMQSYRRKMCVRQSREELIKRGVLKEIFERGSELHAVSVTNQQNISSHGLSASVYDVPRVSNGDERFVLSVAVEFRAALDGGVCAQDNMIKSLTLPPKKTVTFPSDLQETPAKPQLIHKQPPALPPKPFSRLTNHSTDSCQPLKVSCLQGKPSPPLPPKKLMLYSSSATPLSFSQYSHPSNRIIDELQKALALAMQRLDRCVSSNNLLECIMQRINTVFDYHSYSAPLRAVVIDCDDDKENIPNESDYEDLPSMYKDEEEDDDDSLFTSTLALKILRKDSLAVKLSNRPSPRDLQEKNILPVQTDEERLQSRQLIGTKLTRHTHALTHTLIHSLTDTRTHTLMHSHALMHSHTHALTHTLMHSHTHTLIYTHTLIHSYTHSCTLTHALMHSHTHSCALTLTLMRTYTNAHSRALTLTRTHTHAHAHSHSCALTLMRTHAHSHSRALTHMRTHTHTHAHLH